MHKLGARETGVDFLDRPLKTRFSLAQARYEIAIAQLLLER